MFLLLPSNRESTMYHNYLRIIKYLVSSNRDETELIYNQQVIVGLRRPSVSS